MSSPSTTAPAAPTSGSRYKWWVVFMLWWVCFFNYADRQAISSVFPKLQQEFGFTKTQLGYIGSAFMWVYALGAPFAGFIADRFRRKDLILGGCLFWSLVTVTTGWCGKLWNFVTVRALEGIGETFYFPASMSLMSDYHGRTTRSRALSLHQSSVYVGTIAGSWFGAWCAEYYGWRTGFYVFGTLGVLLAVVLYGFLKEPRRGQSENAVAAPPLPLCETIALLMRKPTVLLHMLGFLGANLVAGVFLTWTPTFLVDKFGFKLSAAGLSGSVFIHLASFASVPIGGLLADWFSRRLAGGRMLVQAIGLAVGSVFIVLVGLATDKATLLWAMTAFGLCKGLYDSNIFAALYDCVEPRARATAAGVLNTVGWGGAAVGTALFGWLADHGGHGSTVANMSAALTWGGGIYLVAALLLFIAIFGFARRDVLPAGEAPSH